MADIRMLVSWGANTDPVKERFSNTLYFSADAIGPDPTDYQTLANDLRDIYAGQVWTTGCKIEVRAYNMADPSPRPERAYSTVTRSGGTLDAPGQLALCLSYYSERNLPRQRGRIYIGPWLSPKKRPLATDRAALITFGQALAGLGGANVDWSIWSPTKEAAGQDPSMSISDIWVDDSWDVVRSRQLASSTRSTAHIGE
jgi:hypothetical protein